MKGQKRAQYFSITRYFIKFTPAKSQYFNKLNQLLEAYTSKDKNCK